MTDLKDISGDEFINKILAGERDFRRIRLPSGFNVDSHPRSAELKNYLCNSLEDLRENSLNLIGSRFPNLQADDLYLTHVKASNSYFRGSTLANGGGYYVNFF